MKKQLENTTTEMCQECKGKPAEVFRDWGGKLCYRCDYVIRERLDQLRAMVNKCRAGGRQ